MERFGIHANDKDPDYAMIMDTLMGHGFPNKLQMSNTATLESVD